MKIATIFAIIGLVIQLVWSLSSSFIMNVLPDHGGIQFFQIVWMIVSLISSGTLLVFLITFLSTYDNLKKES